MLLHKIITESERYIWLQILWKNKNKSSGDGNNDNPDNDLTKAVTN